MGLVNELQESAERDDVATVLRKAKRLSSKLARQDIREWLDHEQAGYGLNKERVDFVLAMVKKKMDVALSGKSVGNHFKVFPPP